MTTTPPAPPVPATPRLQGFPHWLRDIDATLPVTAQYVVHGNVRDRHLVPTGVDAERSTALRLADTVDALWAALSQSGYRALLYWSAMHGLAVWPANDDGAASLVRELTDGLNLRQGAAADWDVVAQLLPRVVGSTHRCALLIDYVSQAHPVGEPPSDSLHRLMLTSLSSVHRARGVPQAGAARAAALYNPVFWMVDRPADLPAWMVSGSDGIRQISLPYPDLDTRTAAAHRLALSLPRVDADTLPGVAEAFAESTEGVSLRGMVEVVQLAIDSGLGGERIRDSVRAYRLGLLDDPWKRPVLRQRIAEGSEQLNHEVRGQERAVERTLDILVRSTLGMTSAHSSGQSGGPRGVLFFAGPTGVGKTELAKAITRLVFGDERAYIRFDMSEFASDAAEARLIGAPPGFIGHGAGGELTNAVRRRPFSLVLFDEIEKAHPRILDKFLQVLSDGRLTDGSGGTVHFSETVIVFTSNLGVRGVVGEGTTDAERSADFEVKVQSAIEREFREVLNRPELLGRIGDNIIVFDPISPEVAAELVSRFVDNVVRRVAHEHGTRLELAPEALVQLVAFCTEDLSLGGRGVGQTVEAALVNPLARQLITVLPVEQLTVTAINAVGGGYEVELG